MSPFRCHLQSSGLSLQDMVAWPVAAALFFSELTTDPTAASWLPWAREHEMLHCFHLEKVGLNKVWEVTKAQGDGQKFWEGGNELAMSTEGFLLASFFHKLPNSDELLQEHSSPNYRWNMLRTFSKKEKPSLTSELHTRDFCVMFIPLSRHSEPILFYLLVKWWS